MRRLSLALIGLLACIGSAEAQAPVVPWCTTGTTPPFAPCSATNPLPITGGGASATFGAAFPTAGSPVGLNVASTFRPWYGIATGSLYSGAVAIVDASGNQITSFGASNTFGAAFPSTGTPAGFSDGTNMAPARVTSAAMTDNTTAPTSQILLSQAFQMIWDGSTWDRASGLAVGTAGTASADVLTVQGVASMTPILATPTSLFPSGATPITASATGTTGATTATLAGTSAKTTYLCGFSIRANATAVATGNATVTGTITGTLNFTQWTAANSAGIGITEPPIGPVCIPASATNTGIAVVSAAPGTGGVVSVSAWGYQL